MSSHPRTAANPENPQRTRHIVEQASRPLLHDARNAQEIMARDTLRVLEWLQAAPLRTITSQGMREWVKQQDPPWTPGYWRAIRVQVQEALSEHTAATAPEVRSRLITMIERLMPECREVVLSGGDLVVDRRSTEYRRWMEFKTVDDAWQSYDRRYAEYLKELRLASDGGNIAGPAPTKPRYERLTEREAIQQQELAKVLPFLTGINHTAAQGYIKLYAQLTGLTAEKHQHLHLHRAIEQGGDLSEVPESELIAAMRLTTTKEQS